MATQRTGYSDTEISSAAAQLVQSEVSVKHDSLGPVDVGSQFKEVVDLVTTTLVNDPNASFYLFFLMASAAADMAAAIEAALQDLAKAVTEIAGPTKPITHTSLLGDAAASLLEVNAILSKDPVVQKASYDRFARALDAFRDISLSPNISPSSTGVSRSHPEAVQVAYDQLVYLRSMYPLLFLTLEALGAYFDTFMSLELRESAATTSVNKVRQSLESLQDTLEDPTKSDNDKIAQARTSYLQIAAAKAVVAGLREAKDPRDPRLDATVGSGCKLFKHVPSSQYEGTTAPFVTQEATAVAKNGGPWRISASTNQFVISANGKPAETFTLPVPDKPSILSDGSATTYLFTDTTPASLISTIAEPFTIPAATGNVFTVIVSGVVFSGELPEGEQTAASIVDAINAITGLSDVLTVTSTVGGNLQLETVGEGASVSIIVKDLGSALGFEGDAACTSGTDYNRTLLVDGTTLVEFPVGTLPASGVVDVLNTALSGTFSASVYSDGKRITLQREDGYLKCSMRLPPVGGSYGGYSYDTLARCFALLGFYDGQVGQIRPITARQIAELLNASASFQALQAVASVSREVIVRGTAGDEEIGMSGPLCTYPSSTRLQFPGSDVPEAFLDNYLSTSPYQLSAEIKAGYNVSTVRLLSMVSHSTGSVVMEVDPEFPFDLGQAPSAYVVVKDTLKISSTAWDNEGNVSSLSISGSAADLLGISGDYYGATNGVVFFPEALTVPGQDSPQFFKQAVYLGQYGIKKADLLWRPNDNNEGTLGLDLFQVAGTLEEADVPDDSPSGKVLVLDLPGISLAPVVTDPGWLVYSYEAFYYRRFIEQVYPTYFGPTFLQQARVKPYADGSIGELERLMNPLLVNAHPSVAQVNDAMSAVQDLLYTVAGFALVCTSVVSRKVDRIDAALNMLQERGLDLAYKALATGDLVTFLAMDKDDASSSAAMLKASREVAQQDVPVSKTTDDADIERTHKTTTYVPDAAYDYSDTAQDEAANLIGDGATIDADDPAADQVVGKTLSG